MNSVERVHTALKLGQPDRVPVLEFVVDEKVARAAVPGCRDVADCMDRLDMIVSAGPDGINPIEPVAGMELKKVKELVGRQVCVTGNIDCARLLPHGTPEQVRAAVRQAIADAAPGGGYILTSSNSIHSSCRPENFVAMVQACHEFGSYSRPHAPREGSARGAR
jgi:uroporphyrinogen-III decarboxylase